jgi:dTDP-4-dehydrorhamnose reductase
MRILVTGGDGQLGRAIARRAGDHTVLALSRRDLDVTAQRVGETIRELGPDVVVNGAAMTDVDGCELDPDTAFAVNALGARNVAVGAALAGAPLVQVSSDYVFDGEKGAPYWEFDTPAPLNVYGASKLAAERLVVAAHREVFVVRTAWLYGTDGTSFVTRVMDLARERPFMEVVDGEVGSPTFCDDLADALLELIETRAYGTHHLVGEGWCSRRAFARAILDRAGMSDYPVRPLAHYERPARPPAFAPLRNFAAAQEGIRLPPWQVGLDRYFERLAVAPSVGRRT